MHITKSVVAFLITLGCLAPSPGFAQLSSGLDQAFQVDRRPPWERRGPLSTSTPITVPARDPLPSDVSSAISKARTLDQSIIVAGEVYLADQHIAFDEIIFHDGGVLRINPDHPFVVITVNRLILPSLLSQAMIAYDLHGTSISGQNGPDGAAGTGGEERQRTTPGEPGRSGTDGADASPRPRVFLAVEEVLIGDNPVVPTEVSPTPNWSMNGNVYDVVWRFPRHPLSINLGGMSGGRGGRGGHGGDGGRGHAGGDATGSILTGCERGPRDGGRGGRGGNSGNGGNGGDGGRGTELILIVTDQALAHFRSMSIGVAAGSGGIAGDPGAVGRGGEGGEPGEDRLFVCMGGKASPGPDGALGTPGRRGTDGRDGQSFPITYRVVQGLVR